MSEQAIDDAAVLEAIRDVLHGRHEMFRVIVDAYRDTVYRIVFSVLRSEAESEETVQEIFVKVFESLHRYRLDLDFSPWIIGIAYNHAKTRYRRFRRQRDREVAAGEMSFPSSYRDPPGMAEREETIDTVRRVVNSLPRKLREVTVLYYLEEMDTESVSRILGISRENVKSRLFRARKKMREFFDSMQPDEAQ